MANENIHQVFIANPTSGLIPTTALAYFGLSPFGIGNDSAALWSTILASIAAQIQSGMTWVDVTGITQVMANNTGYVADNVAVVNFTLPVTARFGDVNQITGFNSGGWKLNLNGGQTVHLGNDSVTPGTGSIASTNQFDCITIRCVVPDTEWVVEASIGALTIV